jgi:hypothetical protein
MTTWVRRGEDFRTIEVELNNIRQIFFEGGLPNVVLV